MPSGGYNLGQATGRIVINYDGRGVRQARDDVGGLGDETRRTASSSQKSFDTIAKGAGGIGLAAAAGLAAIIGVTAKFDKQMSAVAAATMAPKNELDDLRKAAIAAGASTVFSASEAAQGIEELAKAGVSTEDILKGGLTGALNLASAGGLGVAESAEIAASALVQFHLKGTDVTHVADLMAAAAGKAQGSVTDMGYALKYAGVPANALGVSIEETTGVIGEFASAGIIGQQAGTTLRSMLLSLAAPTQVAQKVMDKYNLTMYDAQGNFIGMRAAADQLQKHLGPLTNAERNHALSVIFGQSAIQGAITLYNGGGKAVTDWTNKVNDSGYAQEVASKKLDNLSGDLENFKGSLETAMIGLGASSTGPLRVFVQGLTGLVNAFNGAPGPIKATATGLLAVTAVLGSGVWATSKVVRVVGETRAALVGLNATTGPTARGLGIASTALKGLGIAGAVATGLIAFAGIVDKVRNAVEGSLPGVQELTGQLLDLESGKASSLSSQFDDLAASIDRLDNKSGLTSAGDKLSKVFGLGSDAFSSRSLDEAQKEIEALDGALANLAASAGSSDAQSAFDELTKKAGLTAGQINDLKGDLPQFSEALASNSNSSKIAADGAGEFGDAAGQAGDAANGAADQVNQLTTAMENNRKAALDAFDAETQWRQALKDAAKQAASNSAGIDGNSDAALANREQLDKLATAWNSQDAAVRNNSKRAAEARKQYIDLAKGMGVAGDRAQHLADRFLAIPDKVVTKFGTDDAAAIASARAVKKLYDEMPKDVQTEINTNGIPTTVKQINALVEKYHLTEKQRTTLVKMKDLASRPIGSLLQKLGVLDGTTATPEANLKDGVTVPSKAVEKFLYHIGAMTPTPTARLNNEAAAPLSGLLQQINALDGRVATTTVITQSVNRGGGNDPTKRAGGGLLRGPGGPKGDKIPALLSDYEFVQRSAAVRYYGVDFMNALNNLQVPKTVLPRFATGGLASKDGTLAAMAQLSKASVNTNVTVLSPVVSSPVQDSGPSLSGMGIVGTLDLRNGRAYIEGIAQDVFDENDDHTQTMSRMSGRTR